MNKIILVTGGTGYIGSNLIKELVNRGHKIIAIYNNSKPLRFDNNILWVKYDGSFSSLETIEGEIDIIVHLATMFTPKHSIELIDNMILSNILFGVHLLEFAKVRGIRNFINTSTYAQSIDHSEYNPQNFYTATKQAFEDIVKFYSDSGIVTNITLSLSDTYGPRDTRPKFINLVINAFGKNEVFNMSPGNQKINYVYIDDVVEAFCTAINLLLYEKIQKSKKFSVYGDESITLNELVKHITVILNEDLKTNPGFYPYRDREIMDPQPKFERIPNWYPKYKLADGINQIIQDNENIRNKN